VFGSRVFGGGVKSGLIIYRAGCENARTLYNPLPTVGIAEGEAQVASVTAEDVASLLQAEPTGEECSDYPSDQCRDADMKAITEFL
jgi:hypothetical protein